MYSAVPGAEFLLLDSVDAAVGSSDLSVDSISTLEEFGNAQGPASNDTISEQDDPAERLIQQLMAVADAGAVQTTELIIVDTGVENYEQLVADLIDDSETRYEVFYIDENANGIDEVSTAIQSYGSLSAIHFLSHGSDGSVNLGNTQLNAATMDGYAGQIAAWGNALNADGDILFYGCKLAATEQGQDLLSAIGELCDCDIAASDDLTGHESLGGDWDLEFTVGAIESEIAFSTQLQSTWHGLLDISSGLLLHSKFDVDASDSTANNFDGSLTNGASIDNNAGTNQIGTGKLDLDGSNDYVDLTSHVANFSGLSEGTISAWIKTSDSDGAIFSLNDSGDGDSGIIFYVWNGKLTFSVVDRGNYSLDVVTNANIDDNVWHHVAITVDGSGNKLFIDGVKQNSLTYYDGSASTQEFFSDVSRLDFMAIGAQNNDSSLANELEGFLDDVRVYDRGLSSDDISDLFSANSAPVQSAIEGTNVAYTENDPAIQITNAISISDVDDTNIESAVVAITGNFATGEDLLIFSDTGTITGVWNSTLGTLTLTGGDTLANYEAALRSITYQNTSDTPSDLTRTVSFTVNDGDVDSNVLTRDIDVTPANDAPMNTVPGTQSVVEETTTSINGISIVDVDAGGSNVTTQLQVSVGALNVTLSGNASISSGAIGTSDLTIQGSVAEINATLASLTYTGNTDVIGFNADTLTITTNDLGNTGLGGALQDVETVQIDITAVNDAPVVVGPGLAYTVNEQANLSIEGTGFSVSDADASSGTMTATITVGEGWITVVSGNSGATISSGNGTGTVVLTGTLSEIDSLLTGAGTGTISYNNGSDSPSSSTTITVIVNDGGNTGADPGLTGDGWSEEGYASQTINITALNDDPTNGGSLASDVTILEDVATDLDLSLVDILDVDAAASSMTVTLSVSSGVLDAVTGSGVTITGSGSNVVTLDGTIGDLNNYLNTTTNIQYTGALNVNGDDADVLTFTVNDNGNTGAGGGTPINFGTMNIDLTAVNDDPVNIGGLLPSTVTLVEDVAADLDLSAMVIDDVDVLAGSLTITMMTTSGAVLSTSGGSGINFSGSGTSALNVWGTIAELNSFIADSTSVQLQGATGAYGLNADQVTVALSDNGNTGLGGGGAIAMGVINVDISPVNDAAVLSNLEATPVNYTENDGPVFLTNLITLYDVDDTDLESATVQIIGNYVNGEDVLAFVDTVNISGTFDAWSGRLTLSGTDTIANYQAAIRSVTYENNSDEPSNATRTVEWIINDGDDDSVPVTREIAITAVNDASVLGGMEASVLSYTENDGPVNVSSTIWVSDSDDANIESAQIVISGNYVIGEDVLDFADTANIMAWFDSLTGTLTLTGSDTLANYEAALQSVTYENLSENPSTLTRTVSFTVNDGDVDSNIATRNIGVTPVNDAPIANPDGPIVGNEASSFTLTLTSNDTDFENDWLTITAINGNAIVAGGASLSITGGMISLATDGLTLTFTPVTNAYGDADFTYTITDGNGLFGTATVDLDLVDTRAPEMPTVTLLEDANDDGFINIAEQIGDLDLLVTLPVGALEGESLSINGVGQVLTATDISNGFVVSTLPAPAHNDTVSVSVYLFDPAGNVSATNVDVAYVDLEAPSTVGALDLIASSDEGLSDSDNFTSDITPTFRLPAGTGEPGALVRVFADGVEVGTDYVNPDGSVDITATITSFQVFKLTYTFTDTAGNESAPSIGLFVQFFDGALPYAPPTDPDRLGVEDVEPPIDPLAGLPNPWLTDTDVEEEKEKIPFLPSTFQTALFEFEDTQTEGITTFENRSTDLNMRPLNQAERDLNDIAIISYSGDLNYRVAKTTLTDEPSYTYQLDSLVKQIGALGDELREELSDINLLAGTAKAGATVVIAGYAVWVVRAAWIAGWVATSIPTFARFDPLALLDNRPNAEESLAQIAKGKKS